MEYNKTISFQLLHTSDDLLDELAAEEGEPRCVCVARAYLARISRITQGYRKYCGGLKRADCVLAAKTRDHNSEFMRFLNNPQVMTIIIREIYMLYNVQHKHL